MWKVINRVNGEIYEGKVRYILLNMVDDLRDMYKQEGITVRLNYINNCTYELVEVR